MTFDDTKVQVTADSSGIYVKALTDIPLNTNFSITIQIKDNTGSEYSKVKLTLTTDVTSGGGGGIGGGAKAALAQKGIELRGGVSGNADEKAQAYVDGTLEYNAAVECTHHHDHDHENCSEHDHHCGGHCH